MNESCSKTVVFFIERCMYKARLKHLTMLADKAKFLEVTDVYSARVTHLVAQECNRNQVHEFLEKTKKVDPTILLSCSSSQYFVDVSWFSDCMRNKMVIPVSDCYLLKKEDPDGNVSGAKKIKLDLVTRVPMYACRRKSPLNHKNKIFTDALEILAEHALYRGDPSADVRSLAFRRGSSTLKSLLHRVSHLSDLKTLPHIDVGGSTKPGHCKRVILEILSNGHSSEVDEVSASEFFQTMKLFCGIFGVGPQTARKWYYDMKLRTLEDLKNCSSISLNRDQTYGLEYYEDLNSPLPIKDARKIEALVCGVAQTIDQAVEITLVGGFRRGKTSGHDIDLLITHPQEGREKSILHQILLKLKDRFVYSDKKAGTTDNPFQAGSSTMDHFEKCYGIFKVYKEEKEDDKVEQEWTARRVDLIVVPYSQFPYALLGWTGSKVSYSVFDEVFLDLYKEIFEKLPYIAF